jgi:hypothetical protein
MDVDQSTVPNHVDPLGGNTSLLKLRVIDTNCWEPINDHIWIIGHILRKHVVLTSKPRGEFFSLRGIEIRNIEVKDLEGCQFETFFCVTEK